MTDQVSDKRLPHIIDYKPVMQHNGRYRYQRQPMASQASSTVAFVAGGSTEIRWNIPAGKVFNLSKYRLNGFLNFAAPGAAKYTWVHANPASHVDRITLGDGQGPPLIDLQDAHTYVAATTPIDMKYEDLRDGDFTAGFVQNSDAATSNYFPPGVDVPAGFNPYGAATGARVTSLTNPDIQYALISTVNAACSVKRSTPLSIFKDTIFSLDKDMICSFDLQLSIWLSPSSKVAYVSDSATDPKSNVTALATQPTFDQISLYMALQQDAAVIDYVKAKYMGEGLSFVYPHVQSWKSSSTVAVNGTAQPMSVTCNMPTTYGKFLKRIVYAPFAGSLVNNTAFDHQNLGGDKIVSYKSNLDSNPLQTDTISCALTDMDDFRENRHVLKGSALRNSQMYYYNWVHVDEFCDTARDDAVPEDNVIGGVPMTEVRNWVIETQAKRNLTNFVWATFVRKVTFKAGLPLLVEVA